ncbi:MAG: (d)CMP kinase [bacterium]|nr:(d)CMP kinase [Candidatus Sumerlaeota bacterium]
MSDNVILIGMMGAGKSSIGRLVAKRAGMEFIDLDEVIVDRAGRPISEIFSDHGEKVFRDMESKALREIMQAARAVIATGGGIVTRAENRRVLRQLGLVFWLDAPASVLVERLGDDPARPMLRGGNPLKRIEQLLVARREYYADVSDIHIDTTEHTIEEIAGRVLEELAARRQTHEEDVFSTIVTIDGPVGSGKSTLARLTAKRLNYAHVDTGAMYRCVTCEAMRRGVAFDNTEELAAVAHSLDIRFADPPKGAASDEKRVLLNGEDVTEIIRSPEVSRNTSPVADVPAVRAGMARLQREIALHGRSVLEGRDISTVVVPEARWKIYLVASLEERLKRRREQYIQQGVGVSPGQLRADIIARDERDRSRPQGALKLAPGAMIFDTTNMPVEEVAETVAAMVEMKSPSPAA